jgi:hypothetical protein
MINFAVITGEAKKRNLLQTTAQSGLLQASPSQ